MSTCLRSLVEYGELYLYFTLLHSAYLCPVLIKSSRGSVVKVTDLQLASLGSTPAGTHMSHIGGGRKGVRPKLLLRASQSPTFIEGRCTIFNNQGHLFTYRERPNLPANNPELYAAWAYGKEMNVQQAVDWAEMRMIRRMCGTQHLDRHSNRKVG